MITRHMWITWTLLSAVWDRPVNLITHLICSKVKNFHDRQDFTRLEFLLFCNDTRSASYQVKNVCYITSIYIFCHPSEIYEKWVQSEYIMIVTDLTFRVAQLDIFVH